MAVDAATEQESGQVLLFNSKFEGVRVTDHALNFGGNIQLGDAELIKALKLDDEVTLVIKGRVTSRGHKRKTGKDGGTAGAISSSTVVVESVTLDPAA